MRQGELHLTLFDMETQDRLRPRHVSRIRNAGSPRGKKSNDTHDIHSRDEFLALSSPTIDVMSYLTPHKISVLILVEYYCYVPASSPIAQNLLLFLLECIQDPTEFVQQHIDKFVSAVKTRLGQEAHDHLLLVLPIDSVISTEPGRHAVGLVDVLASEHEVKVDDIETVLDPGSVLGIYVRKAQLEYKKLSFRDECRLSKALETYINGLNTQKRGRRRSAKDHITAKSFQGSSSLAIFDAEKFLDLQAQNMANPSEVVIPPELLEHVHTIQSRMPELIKVHYIEFLRAQQIGDFEVAIQSLHRFFDYCMSVHGQDLYQYALLNLAILHARFYHFEQAITVIQWTIETAQYYMDQECLGYALSWLYRLTGTTSTTESLKQDAHVLTGQAIRQASPYLRSLNELTLSKQSQGESLPKALEALVKSSSINFRYALEGLDGMVQICQSKIWETYGNASLSSLYSQLQLHYHPTETDMNDVASGYTKYATDLALDGNYHEALRVIEDTKKRFPLETLRANNWIQTLVQILQRKALGSLQLKDAEIWTNHLESTLIGVSLPEPATFHDDATPLEALSESARSDGAKSSNQEWTSSLNSTSTQPPPLIDHNKIEAKLDAILQRSLLHVLVGQELWGMEELWDGFKTVQQNQTQWPGSQKFTAIYLLALAEVYIDSGNAISAMPLLKVALALSEQAYQKSLQCLVKLRMAETMLFLDATRGALEIVEDVLPTSLSYGDTFLQSIAYFQKAKCLLALPLANESSVGLKSTPEEQQHSCRQSGMDDSGLFRSDGVLLKAINLLEEALRGFKQVDAAKETVQVLYFLIRINGELGQMSEAKANLKQLRKLDATIDETVDGRQPPSWYSFYSARDAFDGILRPRVGKQSEDSIEPTVESLAKRSVQSDSSRSPGQIHEAHIEVNARSPPATRVTRQSVRRGSTSAHSIHESMDLDS
ncbi:Anaphase-promoting complex subunit 5 [Lunasporangiospora selenospora]|uniref:Anaphase-promoting complex subunit 5 n=1 Tax=Lunasporangiospora selenospora TaxID=979761 RepID=A0A9P6KGB1_9FUNG|nr:Anaphase-promoting complex subunit 5 [Lunasporangiospora selenospora]